MTTAILNKEADYLLTVKGNQKKLYGELTRCFDQYWQKTQKILQLLGLPSSKVKSMGISNYIFFVNCRFVFIMFIDAEY